MDHRQQPPTPNSIIQTRQELLHINSNNNPNPILKLSHFLKPSTPQSTISITKPPLIKNNTHSNNHLPQIHFTGWHNPQVNYKNWVVSMSSKYSHVWKKSGIYDALINSTYKIIKSDDLVSGFVLNWCPVSKSFVFEWGECSLTLEDMFVLGGFSVLGDSVLSSVDDENGSKLAVDSLMSARRGVYKNGFKKVDGNNWMKIFMNVEHEYEHEGFLAYWLSMFVFPGTYGSVGKNVVPIAVNLARGRKIALAPAVLASIYRDLNVIATEKGMKSVKVCSPFQLVQVWIWERFKHLRPKWYVLKAVEPRMARWVIDDKTEVIETRKACYLDWNSFGEEFQWRPYASNVNNNVVFSYFYGNMTTDNEELRLESFARCLRTCELVGLDCIEEYLPHRVAMQFGFDQEIPSDVIRADSTPRAAWESYSKPIDVTDLFIPSPDAAAGVTAAYLEWRKQRNSHVSKENKSGSVAKAEIANVSQSSEPKKTLRRRRRKAVDKSDKPSNVDTDSVPNAPPGFEHISTKRRKIGELLESRLTKVSGRHRNSNEAIDDDPRLHVLHDDSEDNKDHHLQGSSSIKILKKDNPEVSLDLSSSSVDNVPLSELLKEIQKGPNKKQSSSNVLETKIAKQDGQNDTSATTGNPNHNRNNEERSSYQKPSVKDVEVAADIYTRKQDNKCQEEKEKPWMRVEQAIELLETKLKSLKASARSKVHDIS